MEGEGALVISVVKNSKVTNGVVLQPEFNVAQHENGINILHSFKSLFGGLGSVQKKNRGLQKFGHIQLKELKILKIMFYLSLRIM